MVKLLFLFLAGIVSGFAGGTAGGGGALIALPALIFAGLPLPLVIPTAKLSALGSALSTAYVFVRKKKIIYRTALPLILLNITGALIGANLLVSINQKVLEIVIAVLLVSVLPVFYINRLGEINIKRSGVYKAAGWIILFCVAVYDACFGIGGGIFMMIAITWFFGLTTLEANALTRLPWLCNLIIALIIFSHYQSVNYAFGFSLMAGRFVGGYWGAHTAIRKGSRFVKMAITILALITAARLLFF